MGKLSRGQGAREHVYLHKQTDDCGQVGGENVIPKELHFCHNEILLAILCTRCGACTSVTSAVGVCQTGQSQESQAVSVPLHPMAALLISLLCHFK